MSSVRVAAIALAGLLGTPLSVQAQTAPSLGSAGSFAVLGGTAVTDTGSSIVTGNAGVSPGHTFSGFAAGSVQIGAIYVDDALARQAQKDNSAAYIDLAARACTPFSGTTLGPGVYCVSTPLSGVLTLDAAGDPHAVWIFRGPTLTTAASAAVQVINNGCEGNVFWQIGGSVTLGAATAFVGSILALSDITLGNGASLSGRALSLNGTVRLDHNKVSLCCDPDDPVILNPSTLSKGSVAVQYNATFVASGGTPPYTYAFSGAIPAGLTPSGNTLSGKPTTGGTYHFAVTATDSHGCHGTREYTVVVCGMILDPPELPKTCSIHQTITASGGAGPYSYSATGLPPGVTLDPISGLLSGAVPVGCYTPIVTATDKDGICTVSRTYTICNIGITPATLPDGEVGTPYTQTITGTAGTPPYTCKVSGNVPAGLTAGCTISGTPSTAGCFTFTVTVTDALGFTCSQTYTVCIAPKPCNGPLIIKPDSLPDALAGVSYNQRVGAIGGEPPYTYTASSQLSCALTLDPSTGILSGTPPAGCETFFTVTATDKNGCVGKQDYQIDVTCLPIALSPVTLPGGDVSAPYSQPIAASGGAAPYTFSVISGALPPGLTLDAGGLLSGTPTTSGSYCFDVAATDAFGCTVAISYTVAISAATCPGNVIVLSPPYLPQATTGSPYNQAVTAAGGTPPYTFTVAPGALPPGLTLNSATGVVSGTPTASGNYTVSIGATDANGCFGSMGCQVFMTADIPAMSEFAMWVLASVLAFVGIAAMKGRS